MTSRAIHGCIACAIEDRFPAEEYPAENVFLRELYRADPEPSPELSRATLDCLRIVERIIEANRYMGHLECESVGMDQFLEEFMEELEEAAGLTFSEF